MPNNTEVNPQITDAVTQVNVKTLGEFPWQALGNAYQMENAEQAQGSTQQIGNITASAPKQD